MAKESKAGERLRAAREALEMSLRDVHRRSAAIAKELRNPRFVIPSSRLHFYETGAATPSAYRLYTLARLYRRRLSEVLAWYGIPVR
jgi:transcriptional regulator with XRE-family HTH domain